MRNQDHLISVIIPVTKMSGRLQNLERSIRNADAGKFQIILVHDRRDSATFEELREIERNYDRGHITLLDGQFGSAAAARNAGLKYASHNIVTFWDSDDIALPPEIVRICNQTNWNEVSAVAGSFIQVDKFSKEVSHLFGEKPKDNQVKLAANPGIWRWLFRRDYLSEPFEEYSMGEDQLFLIRNLSNLDIKFSSCVTYKYFSGIESQATEQIGINKVHDLENVSNEIRKILKQKEYLYSELMKLMFVGIQLSLFKYGHLTLRIKSGFTLILNIRKTFGILVSRRSSE
jgi:glycosyltransferase involved in cell wall biosynthesis